MKTAAIYENGQVSQRFGHTRQFKVYEAAKGKVVSVRMAETGGSGHDTLTGFLRGLGVGILICGGIGGGAYSALAEAGVQLYLGTSGSADAQVEALLVGSLAYDPNAVCSYHDHSEGHAYGYHHEGGHTRGSHDHGHGRYG